jgi:hypothetical protein
MEHASPQGTGNAKFDGAMLLLIAAAGWYSKVSMSNVAASITIFGGTLYIINQAYILSKNIKEKRAAKKVK